MIRKTLRVSIHFQEVPHVYSAPHSNPFRSFARIPQDFHRLPGTPSGLPAGIRSAFFCIFFAQISGSFTMLLTDEQWQLLQYLLPPAPQPVIRGMPFLDQRAVLDAILWKLTTHQPWKELPSEYPPWKTCAHCYQRWTQAGLMKQVFRALYLDLSDRGGLPLSRALRNGTLTLVSTPQGIRFQVPAALEGSWQLATARLLLSLAVNDLGPKDLSLPRFRPRPRR